MIACEHRGERKERTQVGATRHGESGAVLYEVAGTVLDGADLRNTDFGSTSLAGGSLRGAKLGGAWLYDADLSG
jgi:hypothetical protein